MKRLVLAFGLIGLLAPALTACGDDDENGIPDARIRDAPLASDGPGGGAADAATRDAPTSDAPTGMDAGAQDAATGADGGSMDGGTT